MIPRCLFADPKRGRCVAEAGHELRPPYGVAHRFGRLELGFRVEVAGGHTHVAVFGGPDEDHRAKCGDLTFTNAEWDLLEPELVGLTTSGHVGTVVTRPYARGEA